MKSAAAGPCVGAECCRLRKLLNEHYGPENTRLNHCMSEWRKEALTMRQINTDALLLLREINYCQEARLPQPLWDRLCELVKANTA